MLNLLFGDWTTIVINDRYCVKQLSLIISWIVFEYS